MFFGSWDRGGRHKENAFQLNVTAQTIQRLLSVYCMLQTTVGNVETTIICLFFIFHIIFPAIWLNIELYSNVFPVELSGNCRSKYCSIQNTSPNCFQQSCDDTTLRLQWVTPTCLPAQGLAVRAAWWFTLFPKGPESALTSLHSSCVAVTAHPPVFLYADVWIPKQQIIPPDWFLLPPGPFQTYYACCLCCVQILLWLAGVVRGIRVDASWSGQQDFNMYPCEWPANTSCSVKLLSLCVQITLRQNGFFTVHLIACKPTILDTGLKWTCWALELAF